MDLFKLHLARPSLLSVRCIVRDRTQHGIVSCNNGLGADSDVYRAHCTHTMYHGPMRNHKPGAHQQHQRHEGEHHRRVVSRAAGHYVCPAPLCPAWDLGLRPSKKSLWHREQQERLALLQRPAKSATLFSSIHTLAGHHFGLDRVKQGAGLYVQASREDLALIGHFTWACRMREMH